MWKMVNIDEYEMKDNESHWWSSVQYALYPKMVYKQTFSPIEACDVSLVSMRMGQVMPIGQTAMPNLTVRLMLTNSDTGKSGGYSGVPEGLVCHGILPWVHMPLLKWVHFEPGQKGEFVIESDGVIDTGVVLKVTATVFYIYTKTADMYPRGFLYRLQNHTKTWVPVGEKPYLRATFRLWEKRTVVTEPKITMVTCPNCGFAFPDDTPNPLSTPKPTP